MKKGPFKMKSPAKFFAKLPKGKMTIQDFASAAKPNRGKIRMKSPAKFGGGTLHRNIGHGLSPKKTGLTPTGKRLKLSPAEVMKALGTQMNKGRR